VPAAGFDASFAGADWVVEVPGLAWACATPTARNIARMVPMACMVIFFMCLLIIDEPSTSFNDSMTRLGSVLHGGTDHGRSRRRSSLAPAWQLAFLIISRDPSRYRPLLPALFLEELLYPAGTYVLFARGRVGSWATLGIASLDLVWLALCVMAWAKSGDGLREGSAR
jgi:hypothetical protein